MKKIDLSLVIGCGLGAAAVACFLLCVEGWLDTSHIETAQAGQQEIVVVSKCNFDGCVYRVGARPPNTPFAPIWNSDLNQKRMVSVSGDQKILVIAVADQTTPTSGRIFIQWDSLATGVNKAQMLNDGSAFSLHIETLLRQHGGSTELYFQSRRLGSWKWQDRDYKNFSAS